MQTLITPTVVVARAFADGEYIAPETVSEAAIVAAQETYLRPVTGDALFERLLAGDHADFADESLRRSRRALLKTARRLLRRASDYLESHAAQFPLYDPQANVLNRCSIDGKLVQTR